MVNELFFGRKEKILFILFIVLSMLTFLCFTGALFASEPDSGFLGVGPGMNGNTRHGISYGGVLLLGVDINNQFSAGLKTSFFDNLDTVSANETALFLRYYFPLPNNAKGPFIQLEGGGVIFFERGYHKYLEAFPALSGGLSAGWRINLGDYCYVEPAGRAGYPHIWGASITVGIRFKAPKTTIDEQKNETDDKTIAQTENTENNDQTAQAQIDNSANNSANQIDSNNNVTQVEDKTEKTDSDVSQVGKNVNQNQVNQGQQMENRIMVRERFHEVH